MPLEKLIKVDLNREGSLSQILSRSPSISYNRAIWSQVSVEHHCHSAYETPEHCFSQHFLGINLGVTNRIERWCEGRYQNHDFCTGEFDLIPANLHQKVRWDRDLEFIAFGFDRATVTRMTEQLSDRVEFVPYHKVNDPLIYQIALNLKAELQSDGLGNRLYTESLVQTLLVHLLCQYSTKTLNLDNYQGGLPKYKLKQVIEYINEHLCENISLATLSELVGLSQYHFARMFKQSTGLSPHRYVIQHRIERAKELLHCQELSISDISTQLGFADHSHFARYFKRLMGVTPKQFVNSSH